MALPSFPDPTPVSGKETRCYQLIFMAIPKIKVRDLRNGDWYWISKTVIDHYGATIKPIGIALYNCLAKHANQASFCFPSQAFIAKEIGSSVASVKRSIDQLIRLELISKERKKYCNIYYLLKLDSSRRAISQIAQSEPQIAHRELSDSSPGTTNKNKEQEYINKKRKAVENFQEAKSILAEKMSIDGIKIKTINGKKYFWTGKRWLPEAKT